MVKYSRLQSTLSPMRRIWVVMVLPDFSFHSHTLAVKASRPRSWRLIFLLLQLALHHDLGGNAGVVGARNPGGVETGHAVVAGQAVHDGLVERMAHVQRARHIGWWQLDGEVFALRGRSRIRRA